MVSTSSETASPLSDSGLEKPGLPDDPLLECLGILARLNGQQISLNALRAGLPSAGAEALSPELLLVAAEQQGYASRLLKRSLNRISPLVLPAILLLKDGQACVLTAIGKKGRVEACFPESGGGSVQTTLPELKKRYTGFCIFAHPRAEAGGVRDDEGPWNLRSWFWGTLWRFKRYYFEAMVATFLVNVLALATALFIMNVYDRVVPNNALETLVVLATGTAIAIGFEFIARNLRGYFLDIAGNKADLLMGGILFRQALGLRLEARPASAGAFSAQLREFESLRDFMTSATLTALADLPFAFFFIWVISLIAAPLHLVPLLAVPLVMLVGLLAQIPLAWLMRRHLQEGAQKHGVLVEAVDGLESLKTLCAEGAMQERWEYCAARTGRTAARARSISSLVVNFSVFAQQCVTILVVVWGVHIISTGELSVGGLIACVILSGRALAPLGQVAGLLARYQHARAAYFMLQNLMAQPVERPAGHGFLHQPKISGGLELAGIDFAYPGQEGVALRQVSLTIAPGERVAILGRIGSGKSTLLKLLMGLYQPAEGSILLDGTELKQIDPVDLRRSIGYVSQDTRLFSGTLRENVALGMPWADDKAILEALNMAGLGEFVGRHPLGLDLPISEGGSGLSGGQTKAVAIARALLPHPRILLLDEPTGAMDHTTEQAFIRSFKEFIEGCTVVVVTHKPSMVNLAQRVIVFDQGQVVANGPRDEVLKALTRPVSSVPAQGEGS